MLRTYAIVEGKILPAEGKKGPIFVFVNPDGSEVASLESTFHINEHTLQSSLDPDELSRLEFEKDHVAVILKRPKSYSYEEQFLFKVSSIGLFIFKERMVILIPEEVPLFDGKVSISIQTMLDVLLKVFYRSITHFLHHLKAINRICDEIEQKVNASMENKYLIQMFTMEKSLVYYLNAIHSNAVLLEKLRNASSKIGFTQENMEFLEDTVIDNNQCLKQTEIYSDIVSSMMDARASIVNNNLNNLIKTLNIWTIAIMVPTFVVSAFSMNVAIPLQKNPYAFIMIMAMAGVALAASLFFFKWKKW
ncbi:MAG: magnesium transporter CorA family protein [Chitinispirillaceae bacterium]|nr:magnesium transporter CorA family protein [Chitinispirillaceae bacterium]